MGTPADKLNKLLDTKEDLKAALTEKGQNPGEVFAEYPDMVRAIETGKDVSAVTAGAGDVRQGKVIVDSQGNPVEGNQPTRTDADLTANGGTVSVPAGIYDSPVSKSVQTVEQAAPSVSVGSDGLITAEVEQSEGYVTAGKKSATKQLTVQPAKTITPTKSAQTAVEKNVYTTGEIQVGPIPDAYQDVTPVTAGAGDVRQGKIIVDSEGKPVEGNIPTKTAADLIVDGSTVTAPAGYYNSAVSKTLTLADFGLKTEIWTLTLEDGSTVPKGVVLNA